MLLKVYLLFILVMSIVTFITFAADKHQSRDERRVRVPEIVLLSCIAAGGSIGGLIGMYVLRHKTNFSTKFHFGITVWTSAVLQTACGLFIFLVGNGVVSL